MAIKPLFISAATIKKYGIIENNVDDKLIAQTIMFVQDIQLQQVIGSDLYNEICDQINDSNLTALNTTLLNDYIADYLINAVAAEGAVTFNYRIANKGIVTQSSETQQPVSQREVELLQKTYQRRADFYSKRLFGYLQENNTDYPLWLNGNNEAQDLEARKPTYGTGFYLGTDRRKNNDYKKGWPYCLDC